MLLQMATPGAVTLGGLTPGVPDIRHRWSECARSACLITAPHRSGQVWELYSIYTPEQRVAASTSRQYSFGIRLAIAQADAMAAAVPVSFR